MLTPVPCSAECQAALDAFWTNGGVVDFYVYAWTAEPANWDEVQREATLLAHSATPGDRLTGTPTIASRPCVEEFLGTLDSSEGVFREPAAYLRARAEAMATCRGHSSHVGEGLIYAFTDPPYGLGAVAPADAGRWWEVIGRELFSSFRGELEIARWSSDWSTFFDPGREWWGTFWWTVVNRERGWIVVVAASSTD